MANAMRSIAVAGYTLSPPVSRILISRKISGHMRRSAVLTQLARDLYLILVVTQVALVWSRRIPGQPDHDVVSLR